MKNLTYIFTLATSILFSISLSSCGSKDTPAVKEFWEIDDAFIAPADWQTKEYAKAFIIKLPPYMRENTFFEEDHALLNEPVETNGWWEETFGSDKKDGIHNSFSWVNIKYMKGNDGDYNGYSDILSMSDPNVDSLCDQLIKYQVGQGKLIKVLSKKLLLLEGMTALDMCYQRRGNTEGEGPVTVHIFFLQNYNEAVQITVSYHDKNKDVYKDLYNIVATFKWNNKNLKPAIERWKETF